MYIVIKKSVDLTTTIRWSHTVKLSTRARYALRMMMAFARHAEDEDLVSLTEVAREANVSRRYLEQLVIGLKNSSLIKPGLF